jgi:hypothetical protein
MVHNQLLKNLLKQAATSQLSKPVAPKMIQRTLLMSEDAFATPLFLLVMDKYGPEAMQWAPETIRMELEADFQCELPSFSLDKIMAAITIVTTNFFYKDVGRFISICNILAGDDFNPEVFDPADTDEMLLGITEAMLLWPPDEDKNDSEFCEEIREYIKQMLKVEGILHPFDVLRLAFPADQSVNVDADYADDPEMYSAIYQVQQGKTDETRGIYLDNVSALAQQLSALSLQNGSTEPMVKQLQDIVQKAGLGSSQGEAL